MPLSSAELKLSLIHYPGPLFYVVHHSLNDLVVSLLSTETSVNALHGFELNKDDIEKEVHNRLKRRLEKTTRLSPSVYRTRYSALVRFSDGASDSIASCDPKI
jgi:hypothetical protein